MSRWTLKKALELALSMEEESIRLYTSAQQRAAGASSLNLLRDLVDEEEQHRRRIMEAVEDPEKAKEIGHLEENVDDLKIADYLEDVPSLRDASYQEILIYAAKREKTAHDFYMELAPRASEESVERMLRQLALEEMKHKNRLEKEYDDVVLKMM